jgi:hypothetical protein
MINYMDYRYSKAKGTTPAGQIFNSSINTGLSDPYYSSNIVNDEVVGTIAAISGVAQTLPWVPVNVSSFTVESSGGTVIGAANSAGVITGTGITAGTITAAGVLTITFTNAALNEDVIVSYTYDNESVRSDGSAAAGFTNVPEVELRINSLPVIAQARTLRAFWAFDAAFELQKEYGEDINNLLTTQITGEIAHETDSELCGDLFRFADASAPLTWSRQIVGNISLVDHYDSFYAKLIEGSNRIFNATRRVKPNFIICGLEVANIIEVMRNFVPSGVTMTGPHFLGMLGNFKVLVDPSYQSNSFVLGFKGANMFEAGAFWCPYMPVKIELAA